jgi:hypothetical protein
VKVFVFVTYIGYICLLPVFVICVCYLCLNVLSYSLECVELFA